MAGNGNGWKSMDGNRASLNKSPHAAMTIGGWPKVVPGGS